MKSKAAIVTLVIISLFAKLIVGATSGNFRLGFKIVRREPLGAS
jgi:hypothetical protein